MANRLILGKVGICNCLCMGRDLFFVTQLPVLSNMILFTAWRRLLYWRLASRIYLGVIIGPHTNLLDLPS